MSGSTATATTDTGNAPPPSAKQNTAPYTGRFAPSPTGPLHLGSLVAALGSFLDARAHGGRWLVRMEDLDRCRVRRGYDAQILRTLESFSLTWDEEVRYQSRNPQRYLDARDELIRRGHTFECICSRRARSAAGDTGYPGTCRHRARGDRRAAIRFRVPESNLSFVDRFQGQRDYALCALGDFIIQRRDGVIAYQLAVVVDDAEQSITDVVRGADLLDSTPWQILLQQALRFPTPAYAHVPLILEAQGAKLAKSRRSLPLQTDCVGDVIIEALKLLQQDPPALLSQQSAADIINWGVAHWDPKRLFRVEKATVAGVTA